MMNIRLFVLWQLLAVILTASSAAAADVTITAAGDGRYSVTGAAMDGVAGIKLFINYDSSLLSAPLVTQGGLISGALMVPNTSTPGRIIVAIIRTTPFSGSGQILSLDFRGNSGATGITSLQAELIDNKGAPLPTRVFTPGVQPVADEIFSSSAGSLPRGNQGNTPYPQPAATPTPTPSTATAPSVGTLTLPGDRNQSDLPKKQEPPTDSPPQQEHNLPLPTTTAPAEETATAAAMAVTEKKSSELSKVSYTSVLDRFKVFKGERKLVIFTDLFTRPVSEEAVQEPPIAVSDGNKTIRLLTGFTSQGDTATPNFAASQARVLSLKSEGNSGRWIIDLIPAKTTMTAAVSILTGTRLLEIPLVTVPPVRELSFSAKEVTAFLNDFAADNPAFDLNSDGRHDFIDDYIYTGHYLLSRKNPAEQKPKP